MNENFTIYINPVTVNSIKIELLLEALDIQPNIVTLELHKGDQRSEHFLSINPDGKVPVLVNGDFVLTESNAVLHYLSTRYGAFMPAGLEAQAQLMKWLFSQSNGWNSAVQPFAHRRVVLPSWGLVTTSSITDEAIESFHKQVNKFDQALEKKTFLVGDSHSIADLSFGASLIFAEESEMPLEQYTNIRRWLNNMSSTTWWQKTRNNLSNRISGENVELANDNTTSFY